MFIFGAIVGAVAVYILVSEDRRAATAKFLRDTFTSKK